MEFIECWKEKGSWLFCVLWLSATPPRLEKRQENTGDSWHHKIQSPLKAQQNTRIEISLKLRSGETKDGALMNRFPCLLLFDSLQHLLREKIVKHEDYYRLAKGYAFNLYSPDHKNLKVNKNPIFSFFVLSLNRK